MTIYEAIVDFIKSKSEEKRHSFNHSFELIEDRSFWKKDDDKRPCTAIKRYMCTKCGLEKYFEA